MWHFMYVHCLPGKKVLLVICFSFYFLSFRYMSVVCLLLLFACKILALSVKDLNLASTVNFIWKKVKLFYHNSHIRPTILHSLKHCFYFFFFKYWINFKSFPIQFAFCDFCCQYYLILPGPTWKTRFFFLVFVCAVLQNLCGCCF